jgi:phage terminase Nu1 subunit (DNA packaging protein)
MTTTTGESLSLNDACRLLGKKPDTLKKWFSNGCPHEREGKGYRVRISAVFDWRIAHEKSLAAGLGGAAIPSVEVERALLARAQREGQEMENAKKRGKLVDADAVRVEFASRIVACRAKLLALPDSVAARLGIPNPRVAAKMIREEITTALKELAADGSR